MLLLSICPYGVGLCCKTTDKNIYPNLKLNLSIKQDRMQQDFFDKRHRFRYITAADNLALQMLRNDNRKMDVLKLKIQSISIIIYFFVIGIQIYKTCYTRYQTVLNKKKFRGQCFVNFFYMCTLYIILSKYLNNLQWMHVEQYLSYLEIYSRE